MIDICYSMCLRHFIDVSQDPHCHADLCVLVYLKHVLVCNLLYQCHGCLCVVAYFASSYVSDHGDRKPTPPFYIFVRGIFLLGRVINNKAYLSSISKLSTKLWLIDNMQFHELI